MLSLLLALILAFSISVPAFAAEPVEDNSSDAVTVFLNGEPVNIRYRLEDNCITYAEIGNDVMSVQGNTVYFNGEAIAIIDSTIAERSPTVGIEPRTGIYDKTCPAGASPSDYSTYFGTDYHNITFIEKLSQYSAAAILVVLISIVPFGQTVAAEEVFRNVAITIAAFVAGDLRLGNSNNTYATEYIYSGGIPYTRKNIFYFYSVIDKGTRGSAGRKCPQSASKPLRIRNVFSAAFSLPEEHFCSGRTATHRTALYFRGIFVLLDTGGRQPTSGCQKSLAEFALASAKETEIVLSADVSRRIKRGRDVKA